MLMIYLLFPWLVTTTCASLRVRDDLVSGLDVPVFSPFSQAILSGDIDLSTCGLVAWGRVFGL